LWTEAICPKILSIETAIPIRFNTDDKLLALRRFDRQGGWTSLDDRRFCLRCEREFSGRQIDIVGGTRGRGRLRLLCPTDGCNSPCQDWVRAHPSEKSVRVSHNGHVVRLMRWHPAAPVETGPSQSGMGAGAMLKRVTRLFRPPRTASRA
jgi:hypothetical protein